MRCDDWRSFDADAIAPLLAAEADAYRAGLAWDVAEAWKVVEPARAAGRLPGFVVTDDLGRPAGWACFLRHRDALQVAMLVASSNDVTARLIHAIERSDEARDAGWACLCLPEHAPGLPDALAGAGYEVSTYRYLSAPTMVAPADPDLEPWRIEDYLETAALAARAYADSRDIRPFAPGGTVDEWREYIATLVAGPGCGRLRADASLVARGPSGLEAGVLTTALSPATAHIAQLVVDPAARRRGLGRKLVQAARAAAAAAGLGQMTLLVAASNERAGALYGGLGFVDRAAFVAAVRRQPRRSTSVALATGGASTRR